MDLFIPVKIAGDLTAESDLRFVEDILGAVDNYATAAAAHLEKSRAYLHKGLNRALNYFDVPVPRGTKAAGKVKLLKAHLATRNDFDEETRQRLTGDLEYLEFAIAEFKRVLAEYRRPSSQEFAWLSPVVDLGDLLTHSAMELTESLSVCFEDYESGMK